MLDRLSIYILLGKRRVEIFLGCGRWWRLSDKVTRENVLLNHWFKLKIYQNLIKKKLDGKKYKKIFEEIEKKPELYVKFVYKEIDIFMKQFGLNINKSPSNHEMTEFIKKIVKEKNKQNGLIKK